MGRYTLCAILFLWSARCTRTTYHPDLVDYLGKEQALRNRISESQGLSDSLSLLRRTYNIDIDRELNILEENPEQWIVLLKALKREQ